MTIDHYVSQVHLRRFYAPALGDCMYAIRKSDLKRFTPNSRVVCGVHEGSTNAYLRNNRAIEEFLRTIEPRYNASVEKLANDRADQEAIYAIAGFISYVSTCSPAAMRLRTDPLKASVEVTAALLDRSGTLPPSPPSLGGRTLSQLLKDGVVEVEVDPKYPQAIGISGILDTVAMLGNFKWEVLINTDGQNPFFTSDYPVAIQRSRDPRVFNKIVPLTPNIALRILPDINVDRKSVDLSFANFDLSVREMSRQELIELNRLIVRCAEDTVFYSVDAPWICPFIARNRRYWIEPLTLKLPSGRGFLNISTHRVVERRY